MEVHVERRQAGWNDWSSVVAVARGRVAWKQNVAALRVYWREEK